MYQDILNGLYEANSFINHAQKITYLQSLQKDVRTLRSAFRKYPVEFDYTNTNIQASYLLTYFPHYTDLLQIVLNSSGATIATENINKLTFFGSGPCPEIVGYLRYLNQHNQIENRNINVKILDIAATHWNYSREIVFNKILLNYKMNSIVNQSYADFRIDVPQKINKLDEKALIVFQNCLNEIQENKHQILINNIETIFDKIPVGSYLAIIDLNNYEQVENLIVNIENNLKQKFNAEILRNVRQGQITHRTTQNNEPEILLSNLLIDKFGEPPTGLLPKRRIEFIYTLIKKT